MNRLYIAIVALFILVSCGRLEKKEFKLDEVELEDCIEERKMLFLPTGWIKSDRQYYGDGFMEYYSYADKSIISVLCGENAELNFSQLFDEEKHSRKESIAGRIIMYENVSTERKAEFDKAFDKMME